MGRERRFLVEAEAIAEGKARIAGEELHHLAHVLRLHVGDEVAVFDGRGRGFRAVLESVGRSAAVARLGEPEEGAVEPAVRAILFQGIPHGDRMDGIVEKATEIGAAAIVPVSGGRSVVRPRAGRWGRTERWRRIALAAAKQSGRLVVPEVAEPVTFAEAIGWRGAPAGPPPLRILLHPGGGTAVPPAGTAGEAAILVGPEGGWEEEEVDAAIAAGWSRAALGPRILRADTAAAAALALLLLPR